MDKNPIARIAVNKSVLPIHQYKDEKIIFMKGNTEFQFEIFNPLTKKIAVDIQFNDIDKGSSLLVVRPGERIWLDCELKNKKKFIFETYCVDNTKESLEAIRNNGNIIIKIYLESEKNTVNYSDCILRNDIFKPAQYPLPTNPYPYYPFKPFGPIYGNGTDNTGNNISYQSNYTSEVKQKIVMDGIETGIISEGKDSNTKFENNNTEFEMQWHYIFKYKLLPISTKTFYTLKDLKLTCQMCNRKQKKGEIYCPKCGKKF